jgi:hypothetical protein
VIKKGLNPKHQTVQQKQKDDLAIKEEEDRIEREEKEKKKASQKKKQEVDIFNAAGKDSSAMLKEDKKDESRMSQTQKQDQAKQQDKHNDDNAEKLKINEVQSLPDDVDEIIGQLKDIDYAAQDLEVLIELAKQLKTKRTNLFPDTSYMYSLQEAGINNDLD